MRHVFLKTTAAAGLIALGAWSMPCPQSVIAADHTDPPSVTDSSEDIGDLYAWHDATADTFTAILTFAGPTDPGAEALYNPNVEYAIHISNDEDATNAEHTIVVQFGQNAAGDWGMKASGVPGASADMIGAVGTDHVDGSAHVWADLADDPFFFDLVGFGTTLSGGTVAFDSTRDFFAGKNIRAIAVETSLSSVTGTDNLRVWATTRAAQQGG